MTHVPRTRRLPLAAAAAFGALCVLSAGFAAAQTGLLDAGPPAPEHGGPITAGGRTPFEPGLRAALQQAIAEADSFGDRFDAEVWLTDMSGRLTRQVKGHDERLEILKSVHRRAKQTQLEPELVLAVIDVESNFDRYAISSAGALGLMQVMPFWVDELAEELGFRDKNVLFNIDTNVLFGCTILKYYLNMEKNDLVRALARYNGSVGQTWYADRVVTRLNGKWFKF